MCDTLFVPWHKTASSRNILAKNSDRDPNEPQYLLHIPAADHPAESWVHCTYIDVKQVPHTYSVILSKPSWIWGGEIGTNEFGVTIGNEAVWTRLDYGEPALLGMDLLRLGLERGKTAAEAMDQIVNLLETYGQGGNCAFTGEMFYHNVFLIADQIEGWVLETAGKFWAAEKISDIRTISNVMSVHKPTCLHPGAMEYAIEQGWYSREDPFDFADIFMDHRHTANMGGTLRARCTERILRSASAIGLNTVKRSLRSHNGHSPFTSANFSSPCMHASFIGDSQTTASLIAFLNGSHTMYWATGMSTPCIAPFQPFWFDAYAEELVFAYDQQETAMDAWLRRERINRAALQGKIDLLSYRAELEVLEKQFVQQASEVEQASRHQRQAVCDAIARQTSAFLDRWLKKAETRPEKPMGGESLQKVWNSLNNTLGANRTIAY